MARAFLSKNGVTKGKIEKMKVKKIDQKLLDKYSEDVCPICLEKYEID